MDAMLNDALDIRQRLANIDKTQAELMKIIEETKKISAERQWYPIASAGVGAVIASLIVAVSKFI
jgi:hypothetical protein